MGSLKLTLDPGTRNRKQIIKKMKLLLFISALTFCQLVSSTPPPIPGLVGSWIEDEPLRTGLNDFLWARGVSWFKRKYATSMTTWQYEQQISWDGAFYEISGFKGPLREAFSYKLKPDDSTIEMIDLGSSLGGMRKTTAKVLGNALVSSCKVPSTNVVDMVATRTIDPNNNNVMYFKSKDIPYGYEMVATMRRLPIVRRQS